MSRSTDLARLGDGPERIFEDETVRCESCGSAVAPASMLKRIEAALSEDGGPSDKTLHTIASLCPDCRGAGVPLGRTATQDSD